MNEWAWIRSAVAAFIIVVTFLGAFAHKYRPVMKVAEFDLCGAVASVTSSGYEATVTLNKKVPMGLLSQAHHYFGYHTSAYGMPMLLQPGTLESKATGDSELVVHLPMPFVENYTGDFFCVGQNRWPGSDLGVMGDVRSFVNKFWQLDVHIKKFDINTEMSQMKCFGASFETRFCEFRKIGLYRDTFIFSTPAQYLFPKQFLSMGARPAPLDREEARLAYEPLVVYRPSSAIPEPVTRIGGLSYIMARFHNSHMLWHTVFDFMIPALRTFSSVEGSDWNRNRSVLLRDGAGAVIFPGLIKALSDNNVSVLRNCHSGYAFDRVIIGLKKFARDTDIMTREAELLSLNYAFEDDMTPIIRREVFKGIRLDIPVVELETPFVLIVERGTNERRLVNSEEIERHIIDQCPFCRVERIDLSTLSIEEQVTLVSKSTVLIGVHGSGLSHVAWMHETTDKVPTHMIELLPHGYTCRNWFNLAANIAKVKYTSLMGRRDEITISRLTDHRRDLVGFCWGHPEECPFQCHDILRDQDVHIDIQQFGKVWTTILNDIKTARDL